MRTAQKTLIGWLLGLLILTATATAGATMYSDSAALKGVDNGQGVFLFDFDNPQKLAFYLNVVAGTHENFRRQAVEPNFVVVFIGPTVKYLTTEPDDEIDMRYQQEMANIAAAIERLDELGVRLEICSIANEVFGVDNKTVLPGLEVIGDGFVSLIGYQQQGYHLVPIF
ncbi:DsrE family protein [Thiohalomonas denitrificans]|uniref:Intracellular sulfur oxidation protein, DsrE/DsrF family n=1 Tax=Thiohalomonas denitrificans TaxID=415747 RepID=A0A1G5QDQ2_9GAMM|nr:DsrE family protein [Thiohalomonas denitrificans]SCZ60015.1 Intracellular sulfur oxidation protein, DsrE/DsrF family [Thiohalomonas denitrificans]